jgi:hypothetical protein
MGLNAAQWSLITWIASLSFVAGYVVARWITASRAIPARKSKHSEPATPLSDATLAQLQADQVALYSSLEKIANTVKRMASRHDRRDEREQPPINSSSSKADVLRSLGMAGKVGPQFAQAQLEIERSN